MIPTSGTHVAAPLRIFITNDGTHSAEHWAIVTAKMLVSTGVNVSPQRLEGIRVLRQKMTATLTEAFRQTNPQTPFIAIYQLASQCVGAFQDHAKGSPWEAEFGHGEIAAMMKDVVRRNLTTHADIGLRTE